VESRQGDPSIKENSGENNGSNISGLILIPGMKFLMYYWLRLHNSPANNHELFELELPRAWEPSSSLGPSPVGEAKAAQFFVSYGDKNSVQQIARFEELFGV